MAMKEKEPSKEVDQVISELNKTIEVCRLCRLCGGRTRAVPGSGPRYNLDLMLVGEGPGRNEDLQGEPFVGAGGKILDSVLALSGLGRSQVFITNVVKCRPPENRKPFYDEIEICTSNYLERQIDLLKPKLICTLGATALEYFTGEKSMGAARGRLTKTKKGLPLLPTYHPAAILRNPSLKPLFEQDVEKIPSLLRQIEKEGRSRQQDLDKFPT
ncbi:MAG: uracil-DNA glycosylase [Nitrososphaerales archaeon]